MSLVLGIGASCPQSRSWDDSAFSVTNKVQISLSSVSENKQPPGKCKGHHSSICHLAHLKTMLLFLTLICAKFIKGRCPKGQHPARSLQRWLGSFGAWHTHHSPSASMSHLSQTSGQILSTKVSATPTAQADAILSFSHRRFSHTGEKLENKPENWNVLLWIDKRCCKLKWGKGKCQLQASVRKDLTQDPCGQCTGRRSYLQFVPLCASVLHGECLPA